MDISNYSLTSRQRAILQGTLDGQNTSQVADSIGTSSKTVRGDLRIIYDRTGTSNKPQLIRKFSEPANVSPESLLIFLKSLSLDRRQVADMLADGKSAEDIMETTGLEKEQLRYNVKKLSAGMAAATGTKPKNRSHLIANIIKAREAEAGQEALSAAEKATLTAARETRVAKNKVRILASELLKTMRQKRHLTIGEITLDVRTGNNPILAAARRNQGPESLARDETWKKVEANDQALGDTVVMGALQVASVVYGLAPPASPHARPMPPLPLANRIYQLIQELST